MASLTLQVERAFAVDETAWVPWCTAAETVGWIARDFVAALLEASEGAFALHGETLQLQTREHYAARSAALGRIARRLRARGHVRGWRDERYAIASARSGAPLFEIERAAVRRLGLPAHAVHLNAYLGAGETLRMWVARRSASKPIDPGLLDNLVGGGIAARMSALATLRKECAEEAGIAPALAAQAQPAGRLRVRRAVPEGLHDETLHVYDLELPPAFAPHNRDGEVAEFHLLGVRALAARLAAGEFTVDAGLVAIEFLARRALAREAGLERALARLRAP